MKENSEEKRKQKKIIKKTKNKNHDTNSWHHQMNINVMWFSTKLGFNLVKNYILEIIKYYSFEDLYIGYT